MAFKRVAPRDPEHPRGIDHAVALGIVVAGHVRDEGPLHEEVAALLPVQPVALAMHLVHEVGEVHGKEVEALDLLPRVPVAQLQERGEPAAAEPDRLARVVPDRDGVAFVGLVGLEGDHLVVAALHEVHAAGRHDELARGVVVPDRDVDQRGELAHEQVAAVQQVVGVVPEGLRLHDLLVEIGDLPP